MKEIKIESYLRNRNYENWIIKVGRLGNHLKVGFLEMINKIIVMMVVISDGVKYENWSMGNWKLSSKIREFGISDN